MKSRMVFCRSCHYGNNSWDIHTLPTAGMDISQDVSGQKEKA